jgi:ribonuclease G
MEIATREDCPTCLGKGKIKSSILFTDTLESKIEYLVKNLEVKKFSLHIHPYVAAFIQQGLFSMKRKWRKKFNTPGLKIIPNQDFGFLQYEFYDTDGNEIDLKDNVEMK